VRVSRRVHEWEVPYAEALRLQRELARRVVLCPLPDEIRIVAGADMAFDRRAGVFFAAVVALRYPGMEPVEEVAARAAARFPYIPGMLSFREGPAVLAAMAKLRARPDVAMFDGQGIAHPRRLGLAAHLGLWLGIPSVGCAKSRLVGEHRVPGERKGSWTPLLDGDETLGSVLRTRSRVKPVYVSPGHLCDHEGARRIVLECCTRYRLPEPTRQAHLAVTRAKQRFLEAGGAPT